MEKQCIVCGKLFIGVRSTKQYCSTSCRRKPDNANQRQRARLLKGPLLEKRCKFCDQVFLPNKYTPNQPYCGQTCRLRAWRRDNREHYTARRKAERQRLKKWYSDYNHKYKDKIRFDSNREKTLKRDDYTCQECDSKGPRLNVHHIDLSGQTNNPNHRLSNLITLCATCHTRLHHGTLR